MSPKASAPQKHARGAAQMFPPAAFMCPQLTQLLLRGAQTPPHAAQGLPWILRHCSGMLTDHPGHPSVAPEARGSPLTYRCCSGITRGGPRDAPMSFCGAQVLPWVYRCCPRVPRGHPGCPDVAPGQPEVAPGMPRCCPGFTDVPPECSEIAHSAQMSQGALRSHMWPWSRPP